MKRTLTIALGVFAATVMTASADEQLPLLQVGTETYTNVTVTDVTATDLYFRHARGIGNAKLKQLSPELQKHFGFNSAQADLAAKKQVEANRQYRSNLTNAPRPASGQPSASVSSADDPVAPKLYAQSFRGKPAPQFYAERWLTPAPDMRGKFVLVDFWATWCGPCRQSIPHLNALHAKFKDRLIVIGLTAESEASVRQMKTPKLDYFVASDTSQRMETAVRVEGIPHAMLIDPKGIVRYEGMPGYLTEDGLERLLDKYSN